MSLVDIRKRLTHLGPAVRHAALDEMISAWRAGEVPVKPASYFLNLHCHTFFSYNGYGHSPTSLAWLAKEEGWHALATVDFDVLDGVEECLAACDRVAVRAATGMETRVYIPEFATREINSPGEPGVAYHIGIGFTSKSAPAEAQETLAQMRRTASERTRDMVARINPSMAPITLDYERDVLTLTPAGNATERHVLIAYDAAARKQFPERRALVAFWAQKLGVDEAKVEASLGDRPAPNEFVRSKLMKRGGVGYVQPGPDTFPSVDVVNRAIIACGAIPVLTWLDGASAGEQCEAALAELLIAKGTAALNIIPDRNWNFADPTVRAGKVRELGKVIDLARTLDLPVIVGTEMNKAGQKLVDDFDSEALRPFVADFVQGADFAYGHTLLQRALGLGYQSMWARQNLPTRRERNAFYVTVGSSVQPGLETLARTSRLDPSLKPDTLAARLQAL